MQDNVRLPPPVNLKHRIIGAVILVSLAVIFIPMILDEREPPQELRAISDIPSKGDAPALGTEAALEDAAPAVPAPAPAKAGNKTEKTAAGETGPAKPAASGTGPSRGWVVQVGLFANSANAARLGDRLRAQGHAVMLENIEHNGGVRVRLRVGPFAEKGEAQRTSERIRKEAGIKGAVLAYP